jgi:maltooligosyltrehalose trehalohydrolase
VIARQGGHTVRIDGAVLGPECLALRYLAADGDDRLLLVNLGRDLVLRPVPQPLLAAPEGRSWTLLWSSESTRYDGAGTPPLVGPEHEWRVPGHAAVLLQGTTVT